MYNGGWSGGAVVSVDLAPLSEPQCANLLLRVLGAPVAARSVGRLHALSGGLPFFLKELVAVAIQDETLRDVEGVFQLTTGALRSPVLSTMLEQRVARLDQQAAALLRRVALCQPAEVDDFPAESTNVMVDLERAGLIEVGRMGGADWSVRLAHPAYGELLRAHVSRLEMRGIMLDQILAVRARERGSKDLVRLALWELEATGRGDPAVLLAAARLARQGHEFELVRRLAGAAVNSMTEPSAEALLLLGEALRELGEGAAAQEVLDRAAVAAGSPEVRARTAIVRSGLTGHGRNDPDTAAEILADARDAIPAERTAMSLARAVMLVVGERTSEALAELQTIDQQEARDPENAGLYYLAGVGGLVSGGRPTQALELADELLPMLRNTGNLIHDGMPSMMRASALLDVEGPQRALPDATAALQQCLDSGLDRLVCYAASQLTAVRLAAGQVRTAARWAREVISVARSGQHRSFVSVGMSNLAMLLAMSGDADGAQRMLASLAHEVGGVSSGSRRRRSWEARAMAWTLAAEGSLTAAADMLLAAGTEAAERGQWPTAATLWHDTVRLGAANRGVDGLRTAVREASSPLIALQHRHAEAATPGDVDELAAVAEQWARLGWSLIAAETFLGALTVARRQSLSRRAGALGARAAELAALCQGARTPGLAVGDPVDPLSPREREIAAMASRGLRSRDIADSLVVSVRTVDHHLQAVYGKLGITGRRELADALRLT
jgi:DNA-binding CsgD family transcriptional regulator